MNFNAMPMANISGTSVYPSKIGILFALTIALASATPCAHGQTLSVLYSFTGQGGGPQQGLVAGNNGTFYGTTHYGGNPNCALGCGTVFSLDSAGKVRLIYRFTGRSDGGAPDSVLIRDAAGNLYGTTQYGGSGACGSGCGTVFKVDPSGKETVLHSFSGADGWAPQGRLVRDANGNFYGTTGDGGDLTCNPPYGCGVVFKLDASNNETVLYAFHGGADGRFPSGGVIRDVMGNLYGTTGSGGSASLGTVFKIDASGKQSVLHSFTGSPDGSSAYSDLLLVGGNLYGATATGGAFGVGTVFKVDATNGNETVLYNFTAGADGAYPFAGLISDKAGNLYGAAQSGGGLLYGTLYKLDTSDKLTVLHTFTGKADGAYPQGDLAWDAAGSSLYGNTQLGGALGFGTIFKIAH